MYPTDINRDELDQILSDTSWDRYYESLTAEQEISLQYMYMTDDYN